MNRDGTLDPLGEYMRLSCTMSAYGFLTLDHLHFAINDLVTVNETEVDILDWNSTAFGSLTLPAAAEGLLSDWCPRSCYSRCSANQFLVSFTSTRAGQNATAEPPPSWAERQEPANGGRCSAGGHATETACHTHGDCNNGGRNVSEPGCVGIGNCTDGGTSLLQRFCTDPICVEYRSVPTQFECTVINGYTWVPENTYEWAAYEFTPYIWTPSLEVHVHTYGHANEIRWGIDNREFGPYNNDGDFYQSIQVGAGPQVLRALDTFGDGWNGGYIEVYIGRHTLVPPTAPTGASFTIPFVVPSGSRSGWAPGITDAHVGWTDSGGTACPSYQAEDWCTESGGVGSEWLTEYWGSISDYADVDGFDALDICCVCGAGNTRSYGCIDGPILPDKTYTPTNSRAFLTEQPIDTIYNSVVTHGSVVVRLGVTRWVAMNASLELERVSPDCVDAVAGTTALCAAMDGCNVCFGSDGCGDCSGELYGLSRLDNCDACDATFSNNCDPDCFGVWGGNGTVDLCHVCAGDNSTCADCTGAPYGDAILDYCGNCDSNLANDCVTDCAGIWGGATLVDSCSVCGGDQSTCVDCTGVPDGPFLLDECGTCDLDWNNDCSLDCEGTWGGSVVPDNCNVCNGTDTMCADCAGVLFGTSVVDHCGTCDTDRANDCSVDCGGVWGGNLTVDVCSVCGGNGTECLDCADVPDGTNVVDQCAYCVPPAYTCIQDCAGTWGGSHTLDLCNVCNGDNSFCSDCAGVPNGDSVRDECRACDNDSSNDCVQDCAGTWGAHLVIDLCSVCGGDNTVCADCAGVPHGPALTDECDDCDTNYFNDCVQDCALVWGGTSVLDACSICAGDGLSCADCAGVAYGLNTIDECGVCDADSANNCTMDCQATWGGSTIDDACGLCGGDNATCTDCAGVLFGLSVLDECESCDTVSDNDCTADCVMVWGGTSSIDWCGVCGGDNSTCIDCAGMPMSSKPSKLDQCGACDANYTNDCTIDCAAVWGGSSTTRACGVCNGNSSTCADCAGVEYGRHTVDRCGGCHLNQSEFCTLDCFGVWGGDATVYGCDTGTVCAYPSLQDERCDVETTNWTVTMTLDGTISLADLEAAINTVTRQFIVDTAKPGNFTLELVHPGARETSVVMRLRGRTSTYDDMSEGSPVQMQFREGMATTLGKPVENVSIAGITDFTSSGRRLQTANDWVAVEYVIVSHDDLTERLQNVSFDDVLATDVQAAGNAVPMIFDLSVISYEVVTTVQFTLDIWQGRAALLLALKAELRGGTSMGSAVSTLVGGAATVTAAVITDTPNAPLDCFGVTNGDKTMDLCGVCGGDSLECRDCASVLFGNATHDECGTCDSVFENDCNLDCAGTWGGVAAENLCGVCGFSVGMAVCFFWGCDGVWESGLVVDLCGVCGGDNTACTDCDGKMLGWVDGDNVTQLPYILDECGTCDPDQENDCRQDCQGVWGGTAALDSCKVCSGDDTSCLVSTVEIFANLTISVPRSHQYLLQNLVTRADWYDRLPQTFIDGFFRLEALNYSLDYTAIRNRSIELTSYHQSVFTDFRLPGTVFPSRSRFYYGGANELGLMAQAQFIGGLADITGLSQDNITIAAVVSSSRRALAEGDDQSAVRQLAEDFFEWVVVRYEVVSSSADYTGILRNQSVGARLPNAIRAAGALLFPNESGLPGLDHMTTYDPMVQHTLHFTVRATLPCDEYEPSVYCHWRRPDEMTSHHEVCQPGRVNCHYIDVPGPTDFGFEHSRSRPMEPKFDVADPWLVCADDVDIVAKWNATAACTSTGPQIQGARHLYGNGTEFQETAWDPYSGALQEPLTCENSWLETYMFHIRRVIGLIFEVPTSHVWAASTNGTDETTIGSTMMVNTVANSIETTMERGLGCADEESWPDRDHGLICGECKVLVDNMRTTYGGLCDNYCQAVGKLCVGAWQEVDDTCTVKSVGSCSVSFGTTTDAICECTADQHADDTDLVVSLVHDKPALVDRIHAGLNAGGLAIPFVNTLEPASGIRTVHRVHMRGERWRVDTALTTARDLRDEATLLSAITTAGATTVTAVPVINIGTAGDATGTYFQLLAYFEVDADALTQLQLRTAIRSVSQITDLADVIVTLWVAGVAIDFELPSAAPSVVSHLCPTSCYPCAANEVALELAPYENITALPGPGAPYTNPVTTSWAEANLKHTGGVLMIDCTGIPGGGLVMDMCAVCGGDNMTCMDCASLPYGPYISDNCGHCDTDRLNDCPADCALVWGGDATIDVCGVCGGDRSMCSDCSGEPYGPKMIDNCGNCDTDDTNDCVRDCSTVWGGNLTIDGCGLCGGDNRTCADCSGEPWGIRVLDNCSTCDANLTNDCTQDCFGVWGGAPRIDVCGFCNGTTTCLGCDGIPHSGLVFDRCAVCGGNDTCVGCDNQTFGGTVVDDVCELCGPPGRLTILDFFAPPVDGKLGAPVGPIVGVQTIQECARLCIANGTNCTAIVMDLQYRCYVSYENTTAMNFTEIGYGAFFALRRLAHPEIAALTKYQGDGGADVLDPAKCIGCDGFPLSGMFFDDCGVCGGDNATCSGCDGYPNSGARNDTCGVCAGDNSTCRQLINECQAWEYEDVPYEDNCTGVIDIPYARPCHAFVATTPPCYTEGAVAPSQKFSWCARDRVCLTTTVCGASEWELLPPTPLSDRECRAIRPPCNLTAEWEITATATSDRVCIALTACSSDEYISLLKTQFSDRECTALTVCTAAEWELFAPTTTTDRVCTLSSSCEDFQYIFALPTTSSDTVCRNVTVCDFPTDYARVVATMYSDNVCDTVTICTPTQIEKVVPTPVRDRICRSTVCTFVHPEGNFSLTWQFPTQYEIDVEFNLPGSSYVGLGLGNDEMTDTDMVIGWVNTDGSVFVGDFYSGGYREPDQDATQNLNDTRASWEDGRTTVGFRRALYTEDPLDADIYPAGVLDIIYSWGGVNLRPASAPHIVYHTKYQRVQLPGLWDLTECWYYDDPPPRPPSERCSPESNPCDPVFADCRYEVVTFAYICECLNGYSTVNDGVNCTEIDECASTPCMRAGLCQDVLLGFVCNCTAGYTGDVCEIDIDECASNPCNNGACTDEVAQYLCICSPGWSGDHCDTNIDECGSVPCERSQSNCTDGIDVYTCTCADGYEGTNCGVDTDECASAPCSNAAGCREGVAQYICDCVSGYGGNNCADEVESCAPFFNPCDAAHATCISTSGLPSCECFVGYSTINYGRYCTEIDECGSSPCQSNSTCQDLLLGFACTCLDGFRGDVCESNVNECASIPCIHEGVCTDFVAQYTCNCTLGWTGDNCFENVDECESSPCLNFGSACEDGVAAYSCACAQGYDGANCMVDVDECGSAPCVNSAACLQGVGEYTCDCDTGYFGVNCASEIDTNIQIVEIVLGRDMATLLDSMAMSLFTSDLIAQLVALLGIDSSELLVLDVAAASVVVRLQVPSRVVALLLQLYGNSTLVAIGSDSIESLTVIVQPEPEPEPEPVPEPIPPPPPYGGCMARQAANYDPTAKWDDDSCRYCWEFETGASCEYYGCQWVGSLTMCDLPCTLSNCWQCYEVEACAVATCQWVVRPAEEDGCDQPCSIMDCWACYSEGDCESEGCDWSLDGIAGAYCDDHVPVPEPEPLPEPEPEPEPPLDWSIATALEIQMPNFTGFSEALLTDILLGLLEDELSPNYALPPSRDEQLSALNTSNATVWDESTQSWQALTNESVWNNGTNFWDPAAAVSLVIPDVSGMFTRRQWCITWTNWCRLPLSLADWADRLHLEDVTNGILLSFEISGIVKEHFSGAVQDAIISHIAAEYALPADRLELQVYGLHSRRALQSSLAADSSVRMLITATFPQSPTQTADASALLARWAVDSVEGGTLHSWLVTELVSTHGLPVSDVYHEHIKALVNFKAEVFAETEAETDAVLQVLLYAVSRGGLSALFEARGLFNIFAVVRLVSVVTPADRATAIGPPAAQPEPEPEPMPEPGPDDVAPVAPVPEPTAAPPPAWQELNTTNMTAAAAAAAAAAPAAEAAAAAAEAAAAAAAAAAESSPVGLIVIIIVGCLLLMAGLVVVGRRWYLRRRPALSKIYIADGKYAARFQPGQAGISKPAGVWGMLGAIDTLTNAARSSKPKPNAKRVLDVTNRLEGSQLGGSPKAWAGGGRHAVGSPSQIDIDDRGADSDDSGPLDSPDGPRRLALADLTRRSPGSPSSPMTVDSDDDADDTNRELLFGTDRQIYGRRRGDGARAVGARPRAAQNAGGRAAGSQPRGRAALKPMDRLQPEPRLSARRPGMAALRAMDASYDPPAHRRMAPRVLAPLMAAFTKGVEGADDGNAEARRRMGDAADDLDRMAAEVEVDREEKRKRRQREAAVQQRYEEWERDVSEQPAPGGGGEAASELDQLD